VRDEDEDEDLVGDGGLSVDVEIDGIGRNW
jgi:hypothetical protein